MPVKKILQYLEENFKQAEDAANHLSVSLDRCKNFIEDANYSEEQLIFNQIL